MSDAHRSRPAASVPKGPARHPEMADGALDKMITWFETNDEETA